MVELILEKAKTLFFSRGPKSISMEDLAKESCVSKKTIYRFFTDKNQLVDQLVDQLVMQHAHNCEVCTKNAKDAVEEMLNQTQAFQATWMHIHEGFFYDLEKFFPLQWKKLDGHRIKFLKPALVRNLKKGIEEGLYRPDIKPNLMSELRIRQLSMALQPAALLNQRSDPSALLRDLTVFYLHGITTARGKKLIDKYLKDTNETS